MYPYGGRQKRGIRHRKFCCYILCRVRAGMPSLQKKNISEQKFTGSKQYRDAESFEINCELSESTLQMFCYTLFLQTP